MKYMGSKARFANEILAIVLNERKEGQWYIEPFCGGCNTLDKVEGKRMGFDINSHLIAMWRALISGDYVPKKITRSYYDAVKKSPNDYPSCIVGWVGFNCSYSGKFFGGFAGDTKTKLGTIRDYQGEAIRNVMKQVDKLKGVLFGSRSYRDIILPVDSIIYCDPPYSNTTTYSECFDNDAFWRWARIAAEMGHTVFVSEYDAPVDFECVWTHQAKSSLSANGRYGGSKESTERLFRYTGGNRR